MGEMIPVDCMTKGDCLRACIASLLELPSDAVPNFYETHNDPVQMLHDLRDFLRPMGKNVFCTVYTSEFTLDELLDHMEEINPSVHYVLCGFDGEDLHAVICCGGDVKHNPSWARKRLVGPTPSGWGVMVITEA
jgi:hypothetical protein